MRDIFIKELIKLAEKDPNITLITGDLGFGVFEEYIKKLPKQFLCNVVNAIIEDEFSEWVKQRI